MCRFVLDRTVRPFMFALSDCALNTRAVNRCVCAINRSTVDVLCSLLTCAKISKLC